MLSIMAVKGHILVRNVQDWKGEFVVKMMELVC